VPMTRTMTTRRTTLLLALAATLALAACSEGTDGGPPVDARASVVEAMTKAYEAGTMHQEFRFEMSAEGQSFTFTGEGDVDNDRQLARMSMDLGALGGSMDMIMVDGIVYMRSAVLGGAGIATPWVSMDPSKMDPATAAQLGGGFGGGTTDPSAYVALFAGAVDVREAGAETIDGVATTRFEGTIDVEQVLARFPELLRDDVDAETRDQLEEGLAQMLEQFEALGVDGRLPFEIWIDDEGYPRREVISMDFSGPAGEEATMEMRVDMSRFGEPVEVRPPAERQVTDITELAEQLEGSAAA
jgi:hypothetical protein